MFPIGSHNFLAPVGLREEYPLREIVPARVVPMVKTAFAVLESPEHRHEAESLRQPVYDAG